MATTRRSTSRRTAPRRKFVWARASGSLSLTTGTPFNCTATDLMVDFTARYGADPLGVTVSRIRGLFAVRNDDIPYNVAVGIRVGQDRDATLTDTEQNPLTNGKYLDWMLYEPFVAVDQATVPAETRVDQWNGTEIVGRMIDVKSSRKLEELDQTLIMNMGASTPVVSTLLATYNLSIGLLLP